MKLLIFLSLLIKSAVGFAETLTINQQTILSYKTYGDPLGTPVVFIHGYPLNQKMWDSQVKAIGAKAHVITYDQRGFGSSINTDPSYTFEAYVDDLLSLLDHLKIKKATVVAFSMGGYVALRAMERHPERFHALVLADTQSAADSDKAKLNRGKSLRSLKEDGLQKAASDFLTNALSSQPRSAGLREQLLKLVLENPVSGIGSALVALATRTDTTESLGQIKVPTLILVGEEDKITPVAAAQSLQEKIPGSVLKVISKAGHLLPVENSEDFNAALVNFLLQSAEGI